MTEERFEEIVAAVMPLVAAGQPMGSAGAENALRQTWAGYRDELVAEVRDLRDELASVRADFEPYYRAAGGTL